MCLQQNRPQEIRIRNEKHLAAEQFCHPICPCFVPSLCLFRHIHKQPKRPRSFWNASFLLSQWNSYWMRYEFAEFLDVLKLLFRGSSWPWQQLMTILPLPSAMHCSYRVPDHVMELHLAVLWSESCNLCSLLVNASASGIDELYPRFNLCVQVCFADMSHESAAFSYLP